MAELQDLVDKRDFHACAADTIHNAAENDNDGEGREFTDDESKDFDDHMEKAEAYDRRIDVAKKVEQHGQGKRLTTPPPLSDPNKIETADDDDREGRTKVPARPFEHSSSVYKDDDDAFVVGRFLRAILRGPRVDVDMDAERRFLTKNGVELRVMTEDVNTAGGYLVPDVMLSRMIEIRNERGVFRRETSVIPMTSDKVIIPRSTGGLTVYYPGETDAITESESTVDQVILAPIKAATLTRISSDLNDDSLIGVADFLTREIAYAFANAEDQNGFNGDGTSTFGLMFGATVKIIDGTHTASVFQAGSNDNTFGELILADFESTIALVPSFAMAGSKWYISRSGFYLSMHPIMTAAGGNTIGTMEDGVSGKQFLGFPVVFTDVMTSGTGDNASAVACLLGDLRQASTLGDRRGMTIAQDASRYFEFDQIAIRATERFDINVHELGDNTDAGSLVALRFNTA